MTFFLVGEVFSSVSRNQECESEFDDCQESEEIRKLPVVMLDRSYGDTTKTPVTKGCTKVYGLTRVVGVVRGGTLAKESDDGPFRNRYLRNGTRSMIDRVVTWFYHRRKNDPPLTGSSRSSRMTYRIVCLVRTQVMVNTIRPTRLSSGGGTALIYTLLK